MLQPLSCEIQKQDEEIEAAQVTAKEDYLLLVGLTHILLSRQIVKNQTQKS